ncbi:uncharacterized protein LOC130712527 [Lotus japonicus]|uniref:uncharacterized protein LOC130712527 n=1 Tax=Lotus japonicus TaxID=34305 RepID=UPI0025877464|nr:uncharacterized protein LOC130712527 [Lotus japonicus]
MDRISSISPEKEECKFNARILRLWTLPSYNNPEITSTMELVLMDAETNKIHASIPNKLLDEFIGKLREGLVYSFRFFDVGNNVGKYRTTRHQYRLNFQTETEVDLIPDKEIPFYDIIGIIVGCYPVIEFEKNGDKCKRMVIDLLIDGKKFDFTLFGHYVDEFNSYFDNDASKNNVLVVQYARVKTFRGIKKSHT